MHFKVFQCPINVYLAFQPLLGSSLLTSASHVASSLFFGAHFPCFLQRAPVRLCFVIWKQISAQSSAVNSLTKNKTSTTV